MLAILSDVLEGRWPSLQDVLLVRGALQRSWDIYMPLDLGERLNNMVRELLWLLSIASRTSA